MANSEYVKVLMQGAEVWNKWRKQNSIVEPDLREVALIGDNLSGANLMGANLSGVNFTRTNLIGVNLVGANLRGAKLFGANLYDADLRQANLRFADFTFANLTRVNLRGTVLSNAKFNRANLWGAYVSGADFTEAVLSSTQIDNVDLRSVQGLESVIHEGPSTIGVDTIFSSYGQIPDVFLLGCGVSQYFISYVRSLVVDPIEFNSCFISYSHKNEDFARRLHSSLRENNLRVWYADEDMKRGQKIHEQIHEAIQLHDRLLLVLSTHSMESEWVKTEIYKARQREIKEKRRILFPIALVPFEQIKTWEFFDADTGKDLAREIRQYYIPDFSNWKNHDSFECEFAKLLRDLKTSA